MKVIQFYIYMDLFFFKFFLHIIMTEYLAEFPVCYTVGPCYLF